MCILCKYVQQICFNNIYPQDDQRKWQRHHIKRETKNMVYDRYKTSCSHPHQNTCKPISKIHISSYNDNLFKCKYVFFYPYLETVQHRKRKCVRASKRRESEKKKGIRAADN